MLKNVDLSLTHSPAMNLKQLKIADLCNKKKAVWWKLTCAVNFSTMVLSYSPKFNYLILHFYCATFCNPL